MGIKKDTEQMKSSTMEKHTNTAQCKSHLKHGAARDIFPVSDPLPRAYSITNNLGREKPKFNLYLSPSKYEEAVEADYKSQ